MVPCCATCVCVCRWRQKIRVSFVSVSAEMFVAKTIAKETSGTFAVCPHPSKLAELLAKHTRPPPTVRVALRRVRWCRSGLVVAGLLCRAWLWLGVFVLFCLLFRGGVSCFLRLHDVRTALQMKTADTDEHGPRVALVKMGFPNRDTSAGWCACHNKWTLSGSVRVFRFVVLLVAA